MLLEYGVGHRAKGSSPLSFRRIGRKYEWLGWWMPVVAMFGVMLYYSVIIGWCFNYLWYAVTLAWGPDPQSFFFNEFLALSSSASELGTFRPKILFTTGLCWFLCWFICFRDVSLGIEKASKVFMPTLLVITLILVGWTVTLDGAKEAIFNNYLSTDWSKINIFAGEITQREGAREVWVAAFGQIFFTLSLGFGIMITYASYLPKETNIGFNALITSAVNCCYSLVAGLTVFGVIGFMAKAQNIPFEEAIQGGPQLAFVIYPKAISLLPAYNNLFGIFFFSMLCIAGLTSGVSLIEAFSSSITDKFSWQRKYVVSGICVVGFLGSLVFTTNGGLYLLDIADHFITHYGLILGGLLECLLIGWILKGETVREHLNVTGSSIPKIWSMTIKYFTPLVLSCLVYFSISADLKNNYGGYVSSQLLVYGGGALFICFIIAVTFTLSPWDKGKLE